MINLMYEHYGRVAGRIDAYCMFLEGNAFRYRRRFSLDSIRRIDAFNAALVSGQDAFGTSQRG